MLGGGQVGRCKDCSEFDGGQIVMLDDCVRASPKLQLLWGVPSLQWSVLIKSGPRREQGQGQGQGHGQPRLIDACGEQRLTRVVRSYRRATAAQIAEKVHAGSDRKVSENTAHHSLLCTGLQSHSQGAHADRCHLPNVTTVDMWASELDHRAMEGGHLVWWITLSGYTW